MDAGLGPNPMTLTLTLIRQMDADLDSWKTGGGD